MCYPALFMPKFRKEQRESYKETLKNARYLQREAQAIYDGYLLHDLKVPTMKQLEKMKYQDAVNVMRDLRAFRSPKDLVKRQLGGGAFVSKYEEKKIVRQHKQSEKRRAEKRALIPEEERPGLMGSEYETLTRPKPLDLNKASQKEFEAIARRLEKETSEEWQEEKRQNYIKNYMKGIETVFGDIADMADIRARLMKIPASMIDAATSIFEGLELSMVYDTNFGLKQRYEYFLENLEMAIEWAGRQ